MQQTKLVRTSPTAESPPLLDPHMLTPISLFLTAIDRTDPTGAVVLVMPSGLMNKQQTGIYHPYPCLGVDSLVRIWCATEGKQEF